MSFDHRPPVRLASAEGAQLAADCPRIAALVPRLAQALEEESPERFDLTALTPTERALLDDITGQGDVSGRLIGTEGPPVLITETVLTGLWRVRRDDPSGATVAETLEAGSVPTDLLAHVARLPAEIPLEVAPEGAEAAQALLTEIAAAAARWRPGQPNYAVTVAPPVLPDPAERWLWRQLGSGPAELEVRGEGGGCRIVATAIRGVWSVRYFNPAGGLQLDSIEIGAVPAALQAAAEDRRDSAARLRQIAAAYFA